MAELEGRGVGLLRTARALTEATYDALSGSMPRLWPLWALWLGWLIAVGVLSPKAAEPSLASLLSVWNLASAVVGLALSAVALRVLLGVPGSVLRIDGRLARFVGATLLMEAMLTVPMMLLIGPAAKPPPETAEGAVTAAVILVVLPVAIWVNLRLALWPLDGLAAGGRLGLRGAWASMRGRIGSYFWALAALLLPSIGLGFGLELLSKDSRITTGPASVLTLLAIALELGLQASLYRAVVRDGRPG